MVGVIWTDGSIRMYQAGLGRGGVCIGQRIDWRWGVVSLELCFWMEWKTDKISFSGTEILNGIPDKEDFVIWVMDKLIDWQTRETLSKTGKKLTEGKQKLTNML